MGRKSLMLLLAGVIAAVCGVDMTKMLFVTQHGLTSRSAPKSASTTNTTKMGQRTASSTAPDNTDITIVKVEAPLRDDFSQNPTASDENPLGKVENSFSSQKIMFRGTERPENFHIAFIGDSVTRFQVRSRCYY